MLVGVSKDGHERRPRLGPFFETPSPCGTRLLRTRAGNVRSEVSACRWRGEETLARATPGAAPVMAVRRGLGFLVRHGFLQALHQVAGLGDADVGIREFAAIAFAAAQITGGVAEAAILNPLRR